jgi:transglutaminase/protease-like cytokinesis protein 3
MFGYNTLRFRIFPVLLACLATVAGYSQSDFKRIDSFAANLGDADTLTIGELTYQLTQAFADPIEKTRAIFAWVSTHIAYDCPAYHAKSKIKAEPADVFKRRKAVCEGYANLFMEMCSYAKIQCLTINGYARGTIDDIGEKSPAPNHTWNAVRINDQWHMVDATWGSGYTDKKVKVFTPDYSDVYFFTDPNKFLLSHYPEQSVWKPEKANLSLTQFYNNPLIKRGYYLNDVHSFFPVKGLIKATSKEPINLSLTMPAIKKIASLIVLIGEEKKQTAIQPDFKVSANTISFDITYEKPGIYPLSIYINDTMCLQYALEIK